MGELAVFAASLAPWRPKTWWQGINDKGVCIFLKDKLFQLRWWYKNANIFNTIQTCVGDRKEKVHLDNQSSASPKLELIILLSSVIGNSSSPNLSPLWRDKSNEVLMSFCSTNIEMWCKVVQGKYTDLTVENYLWSLRCYFWGRWGPATEGLDLMILFIVSLLGKCSQEDFLDSSWLPTCLLRTPSPLSFVHRTQRSPWSTST